MIHRHSLSISFLFRYHFVVAIVEYIINRSIEQPIAECQYSFNHAASLVDDYLVNKQRIKCTKMDQLMNVIKYAEDNQIELTVDTFDNHSDIFMQLNTAQNSQILRNKLINQIYLR